MAAEPGATGKAPVFVLVHSPSAGPLTWQPTAERLRALGHEAVVPDLLGVADAAPPFWAAVAIEAELPRLPLTYFEQPVPVPDGWSAEVGCGYLVFGPPYDREADEARSRGWLVAMARALAAMPPGSTGCYN